MYGFSLSLCCKTLYFTYVRMYVRFPAYAYSQAKPSEREKEKKRVRGRGHYWLFFSLLYLLILPNIRSRHIECLCICFLLHSNLSFNSTLDEFPRLFPLCLCTTLVVGISAFEGKKRDAVAVCTLFIGII